MRRNRRRCSFAAASTATASRSATVRTRHCEAFMTEKGKSMGAGARAFGWVKRGGPLAALLLLAASCTQTPQQSMPCPVVKPVPDAAYLTRFAGESEDLTDTAFEARITGVQPMCKYI